MKFFNNKGSNAYTAISDGKIYTLIRNVSGNFNAYVSGLLLNDDNIRIAENVSYSEAVNACNSYY